jgi:phosphoribosylanthranilate isomerase
MQTDMEAECAPPADYDRAMPRSRTRIKICGVSRPEDVEAAVDAGADAVGFVFFAASPRAVDVARAAALARALPPFVAPVGLFVDAPADAVAHALDAIPGLVPQFHGRETPAACAAFGRPYLKAVPVAPGVDLAGVAAAHPQAAALLLDAPSAGHGGAGVAFDRALVPRRGLGKPLVLAGGLTAETVGAAIAELAPFAVDVSSGVEASRGVKSAERIRRFCDAVREADARAEAAAC